MKKNIIKDVEVFKLIKQEEKRQQETINLIPSENYPSKEVKKALGSLFIAKYSEGRPGKRYYGGQEFTDKLELLAEERARKVFNLSEDWSVNVQPHSGSIANYAILRGLLNKQDKILSLPLNFGSHLTHGASVSLSGMDFQVVNYFLDKKTLLLDYKEIERIALKEKPKLIITGYTAYPRKINFEEFARIAEKVNAYLLADISHISGLVAGNEHPSPFPYADIVMTTTHKSLRGPRGAIIICKKELEKKIFKMVFPGLQGGPHNHTIAGIGIALKEAMSSGFKKYTKQVVKNDKVLAEELKKYDFNLVSGGTDNHLILIDLRNKNITGKQAQELLEQAGIVTNRNSIPYDNASPFNPSGLRIGTPAVTTRGMKEKEMKQIAFWINQVISKPDSVKEIKKEINNFCKKFLII